MKKKQTLLLLCITGFIIIFFVTILSCNKKFDAPPAYIPPNISTTASIQTLKAIHISGQVDSITNDMIIGGVVIANDSSGNFYKQIIIEDSTGGIAINIDDYNLYTSYPIGRKIYVKLKGLYMTDNAGLVYVGGTPDNGGVVSGIASRLIDQYIIKSELNVPVTPAQVSIADLKNNPLKYMYTLIQLNNCEAKESDTAKTFAYSSPTAHTDASITVKTCNSSDTIVIRTSGYSSLANMNVPNGNGTLTAVYAFYKSAYNGKITPQVVIRDTSDVQLTGTRCDGSSPTSAIPVFTTIKNIRAMYNGKGKVLGSFKIGGVVISDAANKNVSAGTVVLQDGDHGISVYFGGTLSYNVGDSIVLTVTGDSLLNYKGSLEIKTTPGTIAPVAIATNKIVIPVELTVQQLNSSISDIEYTLVKIKNAKASGSAMYSGSPVLTDTTGSLSLYTSTAASFASYPLPSEVKDWIGYGNTFNTTHNLQIRNLYDVSDAEGNNDTTQQPPASATGDLMISEYIEGSSYNKYLEIYNAGSEAADLSKYKIKLFLNGASGTPNNQAALDTLYSSGSLPAGGILVIKHPSANLPLPAGVTAYNSSVCNFNGDDAIILEKDGSAIDVFGVVGIDPGTSWTIAGNATASVDHTVRRKPSVAAGNTNWASSSATEWMVGNKDDVSNLGSR